MTCAGHLSIPVSRCLAGQCPNDRYNGLKHGPLLAVDRSGRECQSQLPGYAIVRLIGNFVTIHALTQTLTSELLHAENFMHAELLAQQLESNPEGVRVKSWI